MRTISTAQAAALASGTPGRWLRVRVADAGGTLRDLSDLLGADWLVGASWGEDVDGRGQAAEIRVRRDRYYDSLSPLRAASRANAIGGGVLLALRREIRIEAAVVAAGYTPASGDWFEVFRGQIDRISLGSDPISLQCRDQIAVPQSTWIETEDVYGSSGGTAVQTVMQSIIDDTLGSGIITLYTPTPPGWNLYEFLTERQSLLDQLVLLSDQIGWQLRYRWDAGTSAFRLTFYEPDRAKTTVDYTFGPDDYYDLADLAVSIEEIRNAITVWWSDPTATDSSGQPIRYEYTATDAASITAYGRIWMGIAEDATSGINTSAEAQALAEACLSDLAEPTAICRVEMPFFPWAELDDRYTLQANDVHTDTDLTLTVVGIEHTLDPARCRTVLQLRGAAPSRGTRSWTRMAAFPGVAPLQSAVGPLAAVPSAIEAYGGLRLSLPRSSYRIHGWEVHAGSVGFAPSTTDLSTVVGRAAGTAMSFQIDAERLPVGEEVDVVVYPVDRWGNRGTAQRISSVRSKRAGTQLLSALARTGGGFRGGTFSLQAQTRGTSWAPDGWSLDTGAWATDVDLDAGGAYAYAETGDAVLWLKPTSVATTLVSDLIAVAEGRRYSSHSRHRSSSTTAGRTYSLSVQWIDKSLTIIRTDPLHSGLAAAVDTWATSRMQAIPPAGATYTRLVIVKAAYAFSVAIDRFIFEEVSAVETETSGARFRLVDDFVRLDEDRIGELGWTPGWLGADLTTITSAPASGFDPLSESWSWSTPGIVRLTTPSASGTPLQDYGTTIRLGSDDSPPFYGPPPTGFEFRCRVRLPTSGDATQIHAWIGIWGTAETYPDSPGMENCSGIGVAVRRAGTSGNWIGIVRDGTTETTVDLGVAASTTWRDLGWRVTPTGVQFTVNGADVGAEATSNLPSGSLMPLIGVLTTTTTARSLDVDRWALTGEYER